MSAGERVYRALLLLYPRAFRREYGAEMLQLSRDQRRDGIRHQRHAPFAVLDLARQADNHAADFRAMACTASATSCGPR